MTDLRATHLPLLVAGRFAWEAAEPGDALSPPLRASVSIEMEELLCHGIDAEGNRVDVDLLPRLPIEVRRWIARQLEREVEREASERAEGARTDEVQE